MTADPNRDSMPDFGSAGYRRQRSKLINDDNNNIDTDAEAIEHMTRVWEHRQAKRVTAWEAQLLRDAKKAGKQRQTLTEPPGAPPSSPPPPSTALESLSSSPSPSLLEELGENSGSTNTNATATQVLGSIIVQGKTTGRPLRENEPSTSQANHTPPPAPPHEKRPAFYPNPSVPSTVPSQPIIPQEQQLHGHGEPPVDHTEESDLRNALTQSGTNPTGFGLGDLTLSRSTYEPPLLLTSDAGLTDTQTPIHSKYVDQKIKRFEFFELWYLTNEGILATMESEHLNDRTLSLTSLGGSLALSEDTPRPRSRVPVLKDSQLTIEQIDIAVNRYIAIQHLIHARSDLEEMWRDFWYMTRMHPLSLEPGGSEALVHFFADCRQRFYYNMKNRIKLPNLRIINEYQLRTQHTQVLARQLLTPQNTTYNTNTSLVSLTLTY